MDVEKEKHVEGPENEGEQARTEEFLSSPSQHMTAEKLANHKKEESAMEMITPSVPDRSEISERMDIIKHDDGNHTSTVTDDSAITAATAKKASIRDVFPPEAQSSEGEVIYEWAQGTSVHGIAYVLDHNYYPWKRAVWCCFLLGAVGILLWQIVLLVNGYRSYKTATTIETKFPSALEFPDVTVCNNNYFQYSKVQATNITAPKNNEEIWKLAQPLEEFIDDTTFNNEDLDFYDDMTGWRNVLTPHGPCFTFFTDQRVSTAGYLSGLAFSVDLQQAEYIGKGDFEDVEVTDFAGVIVFVHQKNSNVADGSPFILVRPGSGTIIGIEEVNFNRKDVESWPYSKCRSESPNYTQSVCRTDCMNKFLIKRCNCVFFGSPKYKDAEIPYCSSSDKCYNHFFMSDTEFASCNCNLPPCEEISYKMSTSQLDFSQRYLESEAEKYQTTAEDYKNDVASIIVNFVAIERSVVTVSKAMTYTQFLSNIGGQMGLFVGISVVSLAEVLGELVGLRMLPRLWGDRRLYGVGGVR